MFRIFRDRVELCISGSLPSYSVAQTGQNSRSCRDEPLPMLSCSVLWSEFVVAVVVVVKMWTEAFLCCSKDNLWIWWIFVLLDGRWSCYVVSADHDSGSRKLGLWVCRTITNCAPLKSGSYHTGPCNDFGWCSSSLVALWQSASTASLMAHLWGTLLSVSAKAINWAGKSLK